MTLTLAGLVSERTAELVKKSNLQTATDDGKTASWVGGKDVTRQTAANYGTHSNGK